MTISDNYRLPDSPSRECVLKHIARSSLFGNLGLFVGAGLTMAVMENGAEGPKALSWKGLLNKISEEYQLDFEDILQPGVSYPDAASKLCKLAADKCSMGYVAACAEIKTKIAAICAWYPSAAQRQGFEDSLLAINPGWIITTNYDFVLETLLPGRSTILGPKDSIVAPRDQIPIFHLHGHRSDPDEIIITQEDYVRLFRPEEYRQTRLAITLRESVTVFLGYGLGDVNVLTALDWSKNVFSETKKRFPHESILVDRVNDQVRDPYRHHSGVLVIECNSLREILEELSCTVRRSVAERSAEQEHISKIVRQFLAQASDLVNPFLDNPDDRRTLLAGVKMHPVEILPVFLKFLDQCLEEIWKRSSPRGAFEGYNTGLNMILDCLRDCPLPHAQPALSEKMVSLLAKISGHVGDSYGKSFSAGATWRKRRSEIGSQTWQEVENIARARNNLSLIRLLET